MRSLCLVLALASLFAACAGGASQRVFVPLTPEDELAFENGIDFIDDPTLLEGNWLEDWQNDVQQRCDLAEAVLLVRVRAVHQNMDLDRNQSYRIAVDVETVRYGTGIEDDMTFVSRQHEPGYASVHDNEARLLEQQFIAFVRWVEGDGGTAVARWHLSPASDRVMRRVNSLLDGRRPSDERRRVVVHDSRDPSSSGSGEGDEE